MMAAKISIVMPCFNHGEFLPEAVRSVVDANRGDVELIVVDDGSTDERTRQVIGTLCAQGFKVVRQENRGLGAARNAGVLVSNGSYILPLDADDRMRADWIDRGIKILDSDPAVGVVYGDAERFGSRTGRWAVGSFETERLLTWNFIHATALYRRSVWEQNGGYDETMPVQGFEDWDFWLGALEHGWKFAYLPEIFFEYRQATGSMITRTAGFETAVGEFVGRKHGRLYRDAWVSAMRERESLLQDRQRFIAEHESGWRVFANLRRLLALRVRSKLGLRTDGNVNASS